MSSFGRQTAPAIGFESWRRPDLQCLYSSEVVLDSGIYHLVCNLKSYTFDESRKSSILNLTILIHVFSLEYAISLENTVTKSLRYIRYSWHVKKYKIQNICKRNSSTSSKHRSDIFWEHCELLLSNKEVYCIVCENSSFTNKRIVLPPKAQKFILSWQRITLILPLLV